MQVKPPAHSLMPEPKPASENDVVPLGKRKAQLPAHSVAPSRAVVGAVMTVNDLVAAFGELTALVTVVPDAKAPVPDLTVSSIAGVVSAGRLGVAAGRYSVAPGVP